jgi:hypothetical protein
MMMMIWCVSSNRIGQRFLEPSRRFDDADEDAARYDVARGAAPNPFATLDMQKPTKGVLRLDSSPPLHYRTMPFTPEQIKEQMELSGFDPNADLKWQRIRDFIGDAYATVAIDEHCVMVFEERHSISEI